MKHTSPNLSYFICFLSFNLCFFSLQAALLYSQNGNFVSSIHLPIVVWNQILFTASIHLILYTLLSLLQTFLLRKILDRPWHYFSGDQWLMIIWFLTAFTILSANAYFFPLSVFSKLFSPPIPESVLLGVFILCFSALILLFINGLMYRSSLYFLIPLMIIITPISLLPKIGTTFYPSTSQPNIILLGIDSLSPESVNPKYMPFFSHLVQNSTQFTNAISPLARTYPAWTSILTGLYTEHHHAEENLVAKKGVKSEASIAWILKKQGYETVFSTDDRRFNGVDYDFGFEKIIGPKLGVNDVLIGTFNDFPLSNLLINYRISAWLFPFNYSNRASFFSYYPQTFSEKLQSDLATINHQKPLFLAVHFTLPHWPYAWAESLPEQVNNEFSIEKREILYQEALQRIDNQFKSFFLYLQENNYFNNCLLVILSDHGETLYIPNSRLTNNNNYQEKTPSQFASYLQKNTATELNKSAGHGSDILSPKQYHSVLAFRIYTDGKIKTQTRQINTRIALIDLAPTILSFRHLTPPTTMDGISLLSAILHPDVFLPQRTFFIESGMFPNQLLSRQKSMEIGKLFYNINSVNGELEIKPEKINVINQQKIYGIISGDWILALYPNKKTYLPIIQNLTTGAWSDDLHSDFAKSTPAQQMYNRMRHFYGNKLFLPLP